MPIKFLCRVAVLAAAMGSSPILAERQPVLGQIDLPHPYYYREMFLPQLTGGPSSLAWSPDSSELIYSMAGTLWRQRIDGDSAQQLTAAAAYDYQPDWSPDGRWVVYSSYRDDAVELWILDLTTGKAHALTRNGAVNVEPRFSPDGKRIVFTSTAYHKHFHVFIADFADGALSHVERVTGEHKSALPRYYYSAFDHEINPVWTRDGREIIYVSNRNHIYGTGGFWRTAVPDRAHRAAEGTRDAAGGVDVRRGGLGATAPGSEATSAAAAGAATPDSNAPGAAAPDAFAPHAAASGAAAPDAFAPRGEASGVAPPDNGAREFHYEETNWKARPDVSPDGSRLVYSSYLGRSWHNLWLMPAAGGDAFPIAYGDWDMTYPRWSPDGTQIAFISNQSGGTNICLIKVPGGLAQTLAAPARRYLAPMAQLHLDLEDGGGHPAAARVSITDAAGMFHAPAGAWIHADDGFDRKLRHFEQHYFHAQGEAVIDVPAGAVTLTIVHGLERKIDERRLTLAAGQVTRVAIDLDANTWTVPDAGRWVSADVHVHMNYGGNYRNTPEHLAMQAAAENLGIVHALIVNKEQRFPDIAYSGRQRDPASLPNALVVHGQEYHTSYWGHLGLLDIAGGIILPGYVGYPNTAASSLYPMNADIADIGHARGALVGYVHPFDDYPEPIAKPHESLTNELPVDMALGKVDYMEILGFSDHKSTAAVWYRLLNLGFRLPAAGGTDAMANYASLRGPVGMNRVYVRVPDNNGGVGGKGAGGGKGDREGKVEGKVDGEGEGDGDGGRGGEVQVADWLDGLKAGRSFATNGPLLGLRIGGAQIGDELKFDAPRGRVPFSAHLRSIVPVDHLDLVCNGRIVRAFVAKTQLDHADVEGTLPVEGSGWCVLRAFTDTAREQVLDNYVYATTSPIYFNVGGAAPHSPQDAAYFAAWTDRIADGVENYPDWNSAEEKRGVLERIAEAKNVFVRLGK